MNALLKDLALEAGGSHYPYVNTMQLERFYNLMIQEFVDLLNNGSNELTADHVLKHFGVDKNIHK